MITKYMKIMNAIWKIMISGIIAILLCNLFAFFYCCPGLHTYNSTGATDYKWQPNEWKATMVEGMAWLKADQNGFNNAYEAKEDGIDILLMGSSHMEAFNVMPNQNTAYLLNDMLPEYTYNIGISGHTIYTCVKNAEAAVAEYAPSEYVIMETDRVDLSITDMQAVIENKYSIIPSYDKGIFGSVLKIMPGMKKIYQQLSEWIHSDNVEISEDQKDIYSENYENTLISFLGKAANPISDCGAKFIIFYNPATKIDEQGNYADTTDVEALELFEKACEANNILFIDMTESYKELYEEENRLAHGFSNTAVGVGHLNKYGHKMIADTLAQLISTEE